MYVVPIRGSIVPGGAVALPSTERSSTMYTSIEAQSRSHVISETESRRVYRLNGSVLTDIKVKGKWVTVSVA